MKKTAFLIFLLLTGTSIKAQIQKGNDIDGLVAGDFSGYSVSMPDANTVAIGSPRNDGSFTNAGQVRIFSWNGNGWVQKGNNIYGEAIYDESGCSVSMPDANTVAIGACLNDGAGTDAGQVRIYFWTGSAWVKKGIDIYGEAAGDQSAYSVSMPDANTVAIGAPWNNGHGNDPLTGHVRIYSWNGSWIQKGSDIDGETYDNYSGWSVSMPDANTVAIGAPFNSNNNGSYTGQVRIFSWNGSTWIQKGTDIDGEATFDQSGWSVSMPDTNTVAIGAPFNDGSGIDAGHVRIYSWNGSTWIQKGSDIDGEAAGDSSGWSVSMPDANTVAIGAPYNDGTGLKAGQVRIFSWNGNSWVQLGNDIDGEAAGDYSGWSVSMPDNNTIAIGAYKNDDNGNDAGHVRVYGQILSGIIESHLSDFTVYPNPTSGTVTINLGQAIDDFTISVKNTLGQEVYSRTYNSATKLELQLDVPVGVYVVTLSSQEKSLVPIKVIKQ